MLITLLLSIYVIMPILLGRAAHKKENSWEYTNTFWQGLTKYDYAGYVLFVALVSQTAHVLLTSKNSLLIIAIQIPALILAIYLDEKIRTYVIKNAKFIAWFASATGITLSYLASIYVDGTITSITAVKAGDLPTAQALLKICVIVILALISTSIFCTIILAYYLIKSFSDSRRDKLAYILNMKKVETSNGYPSIFSTSRFIFDLTIITNLVTLVFYFSPVSQAKPLLEAFRDISAEFITATFNVRGESCGINPHENVRIAILSDKLFIRAIKNEKNKYHFIVDECVRNKKLVQNLKDQSSETIRPTL
jgi:hypothetical protein